MSRSESSCIEIPVENDVENGACGFADDDVFGYFLDLSEGRSNSGMAAHVAGCARCRGRLREFLESERSVRRKPTRSPQASLDPAPALGDLELIEVLGAGGMGKVWKAFDPQLQRYLAVKVMHPDLLDQAELRDRFVFEARITARLNHPNIVQIHSVGKQGRSVYIAMELIDGRLLSDAIQSRSMGVDECVQVLRQILSGIGAAHAVRIIHRDIKPSNIMIDRRGRVRLLDFGLAKELRASEDSPQTLPGSLLGTLAYMSPEAVSGGAASTQWDLYSIGVVAYELLTGSSPYGGLSNPFYTIQLIKSKPLPRPSLRNPRVPPWLDAIVLKLCAAQSERYRDAESGLRDLDAGAQASAVEQRDERRSRDDFEIELESVESVLPPAPLASSSFARRTSAAPDELQLQEPLRTPIPFISIPRRPRSFWSAPRRAASYLMRSIAAFLEH